MVGATYVDRGGEQVYQQPILAKGVQFYGFVLRADVDRMQKAICDRYLNHPTNGHTDFRPAGPYVLLALCKLQSLSCVDPPYSQRGWFSEQEAAFWMLTVDRRRERLLWFHPYIFVDSSYAMAMGREIYGFPKSIGWFQIPDNHENAELLTTDTVVLDKYSPQTHGSRQRLLEVRKVAEGPTDKPPTTWNSHEDAAKTAFELFKREGDLITDLELTYHTIRDLIHTQVPMVFLKQFRDVTDPKRACYQSVVEVTCKMTHFHRGGFLHGDYEVAVNRFQSHPIHEDLGLEDGSIRPVVSYWVEFDFEIGDGIEVWNSQGTGLDSPSSVQHRQQRGLLSWFWSKIRR